MFYAPPVRRKLKMVFVTLLLITLSAEYQELQAQDRLRFAIESARERLALEQADIPSTTVFRPGGLRSGRTVYFRGEAVSALEAGRKTLLSALADEEYAPLRSYIITFYPSSSRLPFETANEKGEYTSVYETTDAFADAYALLGRLEALGGRERVDLHVASAPVNQARVDITAVSPGGNVRTTSTNDTFRNLYRGLYRYTVTKPGYKTISEEVNLIDDDGTTLNCQMHLQQASDGPIPCKLQ